MNAVALTFSMNTRRVSDKMASASFLPNFKRQKLVMETEESILVVFSKEKFRNIKVSLNLAVLPEH
jgi:hypothetical protein